MKRIIWILLMLLMASHASAQITIPNSFVVFTKLTAAAVNGNFTAVGGALNRTGGTLTGNMLASDGVTIDSADISTYLANGKLTALSNAVDSIKVGGGITAAGVAIVDATGKVPAISSTYFTSLSGANLTGLPAANLSGTITTATQDLITRTGTVTSGTWSSLFGAISGANLTSWNAANFSTGTVAALRLGSGSPDSTMLLRGDGVWASLAGSSVPAGLLIFSATAACPSGFTEYTAARGRAIVGLPLSGSNAGTVGTGFTDLENRSHTQVVGAVTVNGVTFTTNTTGDHSHTATTSGPSGGANADPFAPVFADGSRSDHTHTLTTNVTGNHSHTGTTSSGGTNSATSGAGLTSNVLSYIQLMLCQKS